MIDLSYIAGPNDVEVSGDILESDIEILLQQTQDESTEVTDKEYTVLITTNGGKKIVL